MRKPTVLTGALVGLFVTAPLIAVLFLIGPLFGISFVPFDLFDWLARILPGGLVTFGIDRLIDAVTFLGFGLADASKTAEQVLAVAVFLFAGVLAGALLFGLFRTRSDRSPTLTGAFLGSALGLAAVAISARVGSSRTFDPLASGIWYLSAFAVWGWVIGRGYTRLSAPALGVESGAQSGAAGGPPPTSPGPSRTEPGPGRPKPRGRRPARQGRPRR